MKDLIALTGMLHDAYEKVVKLEKELETTKSTEQMWYRMYLEGQKKIFDMQKEEECG